MISETENSHNSAVSLDERRNNKYRLSTSSTSSPGGGGGALPYISYIGMCRPKGYGF